jgi:hypothetical protein
VYESSEEHSTNIRAAARAVSETVEGRFLDEREVVTLFFQRGFFAALGYGSVGDDIRLEQRLARGRADVILRSFTGRGVALIEFKNPRIDDLNAHQSQLADYAHELLPRFGALTNGRELWVYRVVDGTLQSPPDRYDLHTLTISQALEIHRKLHRRDVDWLDLQNVEAALDQCRGEPIPVDVPSRAGGRQFLQRFALKDRAPFGRLAHALAEYLPELVSHSDFAHGAYTFWRRAYARSIKEEEAPDTWEALMVGQGKNALHDFMFSLETAYVILSRLMLAKAMGDAGFPHMDAVSAFRRALRATQRHGRLEDSNYVDAVKAVFDEAGLQAFHSLFGDDIFDWWQDAGALNDVRSLAEALAEATVAVFNFDFSELRGDLLGVLYESYFDPDTRKALGEFYTLPIVVDFILDQVGYVGAGILRRRLLDPACGSGTFLIHAIQRYLDASVGRSPSQILRDLVNGLHVVGFDVNPFAVLMAQVNYAAQILPLYARAIRNDPAFSLVRLPVFRTDSLRQEVQEQETETRDQEIPGLERPVRQLGFTMAYEGGVAYIRADLPVRVEDEDFLKVRVPVPQFSKACETGLVDNVEIYFRVLRAVFAAVQEGETSEQSLRERLMAEEIDSSAQLADYVSDAAQEIERTMSRLRDEYQDGRFLKSLEDLALALLLKDDFQFDYVVGNPPYVRIQNIPRTQRKDWADLYSWASGNYDIFVPFLERAVTDWLREDGRLGFICSNRFMLVNYAENLRTELPQSAELELLFDIRDIELFEEATNYPAIIVARKVSTPTERPFPVARAFAEPEGGQEALMSEAAQLIARVQSGAAYQIGTSVDAFPERRQSLLQERWYLMPKRERQVFDRLIDAAGCRLEEFTSTDSGGFAGFQTSLDRVMVLRAVGGSEDVLRLVPKGKEPENENNVVEIERQVLRPWLFGRNVERWYIDWKDWYVFFPYFKHEGHYTLIPSTVYREHFDFVTERKMNEEGYKGKFLDQNYPLAWKYVKANEEALRGRESGKFEHGTTREHFWYGATYPRSIDLYEQPKLLVGVSSTCPELAFDVEGQFVFTAGGTSGVYGVALREDVDPWFAVGVLNSRPLDFFLKHVSTVYSGHSYSYGDQFIKRLPFWVPSDGERRGFAIRIAALAQELTNAKRQLRKTQQERNAFPEPLLSKLGAVEKYSLRRLITGEPKSQTIRAEAVEFHPQLNGQSEMTWGLTSLLLPDESYARLIKIWLQIQGVQTVPTEDLLAMRAPAHSEECRELLELLEEQDARIDGLEKTITELEAELDTVVAELYKLDDEDVQFIDDFLERF